MSDALFTATNLSNEEAVKRLKTVKARICRNIQSIKRKRSWRQSEKAMTAAEWWRDVASINAALKALGGTTED